MIERILDIGGDSSGGGDEIGVSVQVDEDMDGLLHIISNYRRRETIKILSETDEPHINLKELSITLMERCEEQEGDDYDASDRKRYYISLYQTHLDRLVDAGIVRVNAEGQGRTVIPLSPIDDVCEFVYVVESMVEDYD